MRGFHLWAGKFTIQVLHIYRYDLLETPKDLNKPQGGGRGPQEKKEKREWCIFF